MKTRKIRKRWGIYSKYGGGCAETSKKTVRAHTKSEARAFFKKIIKGPIPKHWLVSELPI